jgi:hypothetical protein
VPIGCRARICRRVGSIIEDLELLLLASEQHELVNQIVFVPL